VDNVSSGTEVMLSTADRALVLVAVAADRLLAGVSRPRVVLRQGMRIVVEGHADLRVAKSLADVRDRLAVPEQHCRTAVPQAVEREPQLRYSGLSGAFASNRADGSLTL
jgi:hypothetical protein